VPPWDGGYHIFNDKMNDHYKHPKRGRRNKVGRWYYNNKKNKTRGNTRAPKIWYRENLPSLISVYQMCRNFSP